MANIENVMIRASAGSGKTHQLALRYLSLLVLDVKPERIIALTFTKKAAAEFAERILTQLATACENEENATALKKDVSLTILGDPTNIKAMPALVESAILLPSMDVHFFRGLLEKMVVALNQLALSTLDSFFVKLLKNFAYELGMSGFELKEGYELDEERIRVFAEIFQRSSHSPEQAKVLKEFVHAFQKSSVGEAPIALNRRLEEFVNTHQHRWLKNPDLASWGNAKQLWPNTNGLPYMPCSRTGGYRVLVDQIRQCIAETEFGNKTFSKSLITMCDELEDRDGKAGLPLTLRTRSKEFLQNLDDLASGSYIHMVGKKEITIGGDLCELLYQLFSGLIADEIQAKITSTQGIHTVIKAYESHYSSSVRGQGRLGFSDATLMLSGSKGVGIFDQVSKELVDFRFDGKYDHWMLDEFQDTSTTQWEVIKNLIDEVVNNSESDRSLFVVGDTKQGIYGWRGGDPKLFDRLTDSYQDRLTEVPMDQSHRSSPSVLELVNQVFDPKSAGMRNFPQAALDRWKFQNHTTAERISDRKGHSWVCEIQKFDEEQGMAELKHQWIGALVNKLNPVKRGISCAILTRTNKQGREIADYLRKHHRTIPVAMEDNNLVAEENPVTAAIVDAFRFLAHPQDTLAWWHIKMSPLSKLIIKEKKQRDVWYHWSRQIARFGVVEVLNYWVNELKQVVELSSYTLNKLQEIEIAADEFSSHGGSLTDWLLKLEHWNQREVTREGVVQIMTVFKAKGLGFDAVIIPELDNDKFGHEKWLKVIESEGSGDKLGQILMPPAQAIRDAVPELKAMTDEWVANQCYEQFCVLYVMLTRAKHGTYCLLDGSKDDPSKFRNNEADWIRESVRDENKREITFETEAGELHGILDAEFGGWDWLDELKPDNLTEPNKNNITPIQLPQAIARSASDLVDHDADKQVGSRLMDNGGIQFGNLVHQAFESIKWWDGQLPWKQASKHPDIAHLVAECMEQPSIAPYFNGDNGLEVHREQSLEAIIDGVWTSGIIDRLILAYDDAGKVAHAAIIDIKTDKLGSAEQLVELHHEQLAHYKTILSQLYNLSSEQIHPVILSTYLRKTIRLK